MRAVLFLAGWTILRRFQQGKRGSDVVICGNKCDLQGREVAREEGEQLAAELGVPYMETSAKDNLNVEETFGNLASRVRAPVGV